jgi:ATP-binding cassette subfamily F protein uup
MAHVPLLSLRDATVGYGGPPLFEGLSLSVGRGERIGLVGRNGTGKSTLLGCLAGIVELDAGTRVVQPGVTVAVLAQTPKLDGTATALQYAEAGGGESYRARTLLIHLGVDPDAQVSTLSGGQSRRAALARALACDPEVLLLDEPTNHLDMPTIEWLEAELNRRSCGVVVVSHDRAFLRATTTSTVWLKRGKALRTERGYRDFELFANEVAQAEAAELDRLEAHLAAEERYRLYGVTARRSRNQRRVEKLHELRAQRRKMLENRGKFSVQTVEVAQSGQMVLEAENISKSYGEKTVIKGFSTRIVRGDRVGLIGRNGAGKTTLLKMLLGLLEPDRGALRQGAGFKAAYFDQYREALDPEATLWNTLAPDGGDQVWAQGRQKHVVSYLRDFLFDSRQAHSPVKTLSGGERNRLLLAKLLMEPVSVLALDEPTNDLDLETMELLEELLADFDGTIFLVSHDREFLDRVATSVIAVEDDGECTEYPGGYSDYFRLRPAAAKPLVREAPKVEQPKKKVPTRLSFNENRELAELPAKLAAAEQKIAELELRLQQPEKMGAQPGAYAEAWKALEDTRAQHAELEERWLELELKRESLG